MSLAPTGSPARIFVRRRGGEIFRVARLSVVAGEGGQEFEFICGTGFSDFFEQLFGSRMRGGAGGFGRSAGFEEEEFPERGRDIEGDIMVTLEEAMRGSVRSVNVRRPVGSFGEDRNLPGQDSARCD